MRKITLIILFLVTGVAVLWLVESPSYFFSNDNSVESSLEVTKTSNTVSVYDGVDVPVDIKVLDLSGSNLTGSLKSEIGQLGELQVLNLSGNQFTGLPAEIGRLEKLEVINLSQNPITGLPYELGNLKNLKSLDLSGTMYAPQDLAIIQEQLPELIVVTD